MNSIENNIKKDIGELVLSIGEGKFPEKAKELLVNQFRKGYAFKEEKIKNENAAITESKMTKVRAFFEEKKEFYANETITELLNEIEWKLESDILLEDIVKKEEKD
jgi:hypothetical protein